MNNKKIKKRRKEEMGEKVGGKEVQDERWVKKTRCRRVMWIVEKKGKNRNAHTHVHTNTCIHTYISGGSRGGGGGRIGRGPPSFWPIFFIFGGGIEEFGFPAPPFH